MSKTSNCLNCESELDTSFNYCPVCGQKSSEDLTMKVLFNQTISNYFSIDARFFKSYIPLMFKPGVVARRYVDGKRLQYLHPAQFYLFISVIFFFLFSLVTRQQQQEFESAIKKGFETDINEKFTPANLNPENTKNLKEALANNKTLMDSISQKEQAENLMLLDSVLADTINIEILGFSAKKSSLDSLILTNAPKEEKLALFGVTEKSGGFQRLLGSQMLKIYEQRGGGILKSFYDTIPIAMFFLLPIFALILKILYYNKGYFAHHMVFSLYFFTFLFMVLCFVAFINLITDVPVWLDTLVIVSTGIYLILALRKFYGQGFIKTIFKTGILSFTYFMIVIPLSLVFMVFLSLLLY